VEIVPRTLLPTTTMASAAAPLKQPERGFPETTPGLLIPTAAGQIPHLTPDILAHLFARFPTVYISVPYSALSPLQRSMGEVHAGLNHSREHVKVFITHRAVVDSARPASVPAPDPAEVCRVICSSLRPDYFVSPGDAIPLGTGSNRTNQALERTKRGVECARGGKALGAVIGKDDVSMAKSVNAVVAAGLGGGVYVDVASHALAMRLLLGGGGEKERGGGSAGPRVVADGLAGPRRILELVCAGADLVESGYAEVMARFGMACSFQVSAVLKPALTRTQLNARDARFLTDLGPLVEGCTCFACTHHSRAYIRHLVETQEMLGETLLMAHNLDRLLSLMETLQAVAEKDGGLQAWAECWTRWHE
jgi:hypothetical protein